MKKKYFLLISIFIIAGVIFLQGNVKGYQSSSKYIQGEYNYDKSTGLYYKVVSNEITITGVDEGIKNIKIPSSYNGKKVTKIGNSALCPLGDTSTIETITMPNTVLSIDDSAFRNCENLKTVKLPSNLKFLGWGAFNGCSSLTSIELTTDKIESCVFWGCRNLKKVVFNENTTDLSCLSNLLFNEECYSLSEIYVPNTVATIPKYISNSKYMKNATIYFSKNSPCYYSMIYCCTNNNLKYSILDIPFFDVKKNDFFYSSVKYAFDKKIIYGKKENTFLPYDKITRGELVTILHRMENYPKATTSNKFKDVQKGLFYYDAILWASSKNIVHGYNSIKFGPNDYITREQLATILLNYARYKKLDIKSRTNITKFKDNNTVNSYAKDGISWAVAKGVMSGKDNGTRLDPLGNATRGEVAVMIANFCRNVKK